MASVLARHPSDSRTRRHSGADVDEGEVDVVLYDALSLMGADGDAREREPELD